MLLQANKSFFRDHFVFFIVLIFLGAIFARAFYVLIIQADFLQKEGNKRQIRTLDIPAPRGNVFDRNGQILALSTRIDSVWVDPKVLSFYLDPVQQQIKLEQEPMTAKQFAKHQKQIEKYQQSYLKLLSLLNLSEETITTRIIANKRKRFLYLKRSVLPDLGDEIDGLDVPGLYVDNEYKRYYPAGEVTSHLVGFTNIDDQGIAGVEKTYDQWLSGQAGKKQVVKDLSGKVVSFVKDLKPAKSGQDIYLSIDKDMQYFLYHSMKKSFIMHQPKSIESVILDAKTGEVMAMVSLPSFNPNNRKQLSGSRLRDRVISDRIEPGSTLKPLVIAKALDMGILGLEEEIKTAPGYIRVQEQRITDSKNYGALTPAGIIQKSSNVGMTKVALRMKPEDEWQFFRDLGFGEFLGLYLPGETQGFLRPAEEWTPIYQATAAYGYGLDVNLMQLARAYMIFSNDGAIKPVSILKTDNTDEGKQVVSPEAAKAVLRMMEKVTQKKGTAPQAKVDGFRVAGKTGTVHRTKAGGYEENQYLSLFAGMMPASDPRYIMVTCVTEPSRGVYYGGKVAAPVFKEVMTEIARLKDLAPDDSMDNHRK